MERSMTREAKVITADEVGRDADLTIPRSLADLSKLLDRKDPQLKKGGCFVRYLRLRFFP